MYVGSDSVVVICKGDAYSILPSFFCVH